MRDLVGVQRRRRRWIIRGTFPYISIKLVALHILLALTVWRRDWRTTVHAGVASLSSRNGATMTSRTGKGTDGASVVGHTTIS